LLNRTDYRPIEIIIVDHDSDDNNTAQYLSEIKKNPQIKILNYSGPFNYSRINNIAAKKAEGSILAFINNDTEVINPDWLTEMVSIAELKRTGAVGAKLLYPNNTIQHGGVTVGLGGVAGHVHVGLKASDGGYYSRLHLSQEISAVTGACLLVKRSIFFEVGGFDENLAVALNDIDLCLKIRKAGYRNIWTPFARLYHKESYSRGLDDTGEKLVRLREEILIMKKKWGPGMLVSDPYFNPNLSLYSHHFDLAFPPRKRPAWLGQMVG